MEKVISLLEGLHTEVEQEGTSEASAYDEFACFCKATTETKSTHILEAKANIDALSSDIAELTAQQKVDVQELTDRQVKHETLQADLTSTQEEFDKEKADFGLSSADLGKAVSSLKSAIDSLSAAKPSAAMLLSVKRVVSNSLALARAAGLAAASGPKVGDSFLQARTAVDPMSPEYKYHSEGILSTMTQLHEEFSAKLTELQSEWKKTKDNFEEKIKDLGLEIEKNEIRTKELEESVEGLKVSIADDRKALVLEEVETKDDKVYLQDLTERCEARAKDWDQRSQMRAGELEAITQALKILEERAKPLDAEVNERALLQEVAGRAGAARATSRERPAAAAGEAKRAIKHAPSFLQGVSVRGHDHASEAFRERRDQAARMLQQESRRLKSPVLASILVQVGADPFEKVKKLIQELIERLLTEANSEASKESFCKEELAKAEKERGYRYEDAKKASVEIGALETKRAELTAEIAELKDDLDDLNETLFKMTDQRALQHDLNLVTIKKGKEGLEAVTEAIVVLKTYYKQAAKAAALVQASPVDEATDGPGFSGSYGGKQASSKGIIGMLEVIKTDFDRTVRVTEAEEKDAQEKFVDFDRVSQADMASKRTKLELNQEDLATTEAGVKTAYTDLTTAIDLMDATVKRLEALQPTCTDFGMPYEVRVEKRKKEIEALKSALCILDPEGVEESCGS